LQTGDTRATHPQMRMQRDPHCPAAGIHQRHFEVRRCDPPLELSYVNARTSSR
jgi:hypothetical protein